MSSHLDFIMAEVRTATTRDGRCRCLRSACFSQKPSDVAEWLDEFDQGNRLVVLDGGTSVSKSMFCETHGTPTPPTVDEQIEVTVESLGDGAYVAGVHE